MSLLTITNKYIFCDIFFRIPIKRRLAIIDNSKAYYDKLDYFPIIKSIYNKISNFMDNKINSNFNYEKINFPSFLKDKKENKLKILSYGSINYTISDLENKFKKDFSDNFKELLKELFLDLLISKNIYLSKQKYSEFNDYNSILKFNYHNHIIKYDNALCKQLTDELKRIIYNDNKIFGVKIKIKDININKLASLNYIFKNIHFLKLDFSGFFNNFNDEEITQIFSCLADFVKENPIEIFYFTDNTERTLSFVENFQMLTEYLIKLNKFYIKKNFENKDTHALLLKAYKEDNDEIISKIEDSNLILENYLKNINKKIKWLNLNICNPCSINGELDECYSFCEVATPSEEFSLISKFQCLEELILSYKWEGDYYYDFDKNDSLSDAINSIKTLKNVIFKKYDYFLKALSKIKVENACFITKYYDYNPNKKNLKAIIQSEMLNDIKNIEIKTFKVSSNFVSYKDKILKYEIEDLEIDDFLNCNCDNMPGLKNLEQLFIKIRYYYYDDKRDYSKIILNLILSACKQNNNLKNIYINYIHCELNEILNILNDYCNSNDRLKNIELFGKVEASNINTILDYIFKIKNKKVDININIQDNNISEIISENEYIKKGNLSFEKINMKIHSGKDYTINLLKIK